MNEMGEDLAFTPLGANRTATDIATGAEHACALLDNDSVKCWGYNNAGRTGLGTGTGNTGDAVGDMWGDNLASIEMGTGRTATTISAGSSHTCALLDDGSVKCWGWDGYGQSSPPAGSFERVSAGVYHTCGVTTSGNVECWGLNDDGQSSPPAGSFERVGAGWVHTCGVRTSGDIECWGSNNAGQSTAPGL